MVHGGVFSEQHGCVDREKQNHSLLKMVGLGTGFLKESGFVLRNKSKPTMCTNIFISVYLLHQFFQFSPVTEGVFQQFSFR